MNNPKHFITVQDTLQCYKHPKAVHYVNMIFNLSNGFFTLDKNISCSQYEIRCLYTKQKHESRSTQTVASGSDAAHHEPTYNLPSGPWASPLILQRQLRDHVVMTKHQQCMECCYCHTQVVPTSYIHFTSICFYILSNC